MSKNTDLLNALGIPALERVYRLARRVRSDGAVSPWCVDPNKPRAVNLKKASWALRIEAVTCQKCLDAAKAHDEAIKTVNVEGGES